jgi:hypothetical protein
MGNFLCCCGDNDSYQKQIDDDKRKSKITIKKYDDSNEKNIKRNDNQKEDIKKKHETLIMKKEIEKKAFKNFISTRMSVNLSSKEGKKQKILVKNKIKKKLEFLETEITYVNNLNILSEYYIQPLKDLMSSDDIKKIFCNIDMVLAINNMFLNKMKDVIESEKDIEKEFALLLKDFSMSFKLYTGYVSNYSNALERLRSKQKDQKIYDFLKKVEKILKEEGERITDIHSYMILPIQRLPRYRMLLEDVNFFNNL